MLTRLLLRGCRSGYFQNRGTRAPRFYSFRYFQLREKLGFPVRVPSPETETRISLEYFHTFIAGRVLMLLTGSETIDPSAFLSEFLSMQKSDRSRIRVVTACWLHWQRLNNSERPVIKIGFRSAAKYVHAYLAVRDWPSYASITI